MNHWLRIWERARAPHPHGVAGRMLHPLLRAASWGYRPALALRNWAYDRGKLSSYTPSIETISIGNLLLGGTGKTPLTLALAKKLANRAPFAILSRGYKGSVEHEKEPIWACKGGGALEPPERVGDEPYLLARRLPHSWILAGRNRVRAAQMAEAAGATLLLLDDGLQHRSLARSREIILMDERPSLERMPLFPAGLLREPLSALRRADLILVHHVGPVLPAWCRSQLERFSGAPIVGMQLMPEALVGEEGRETPASLEGKRVGAFCGIGSPSRFYRTLAGLGAKVALQWTLPDHAPFPLEQGRRFLASCQKGGVEEVVCTEKDWVKLPSALFQESSLPIRYLEVGVHFPDGEAELLSWLLSSE